MSELKKVLILSPPHSGSTILKCMLAKCPEIHCIDGEGHHIKDEDCVKDKINLQKFPLFHSREQILRLSGYKIILLARDPRYCVSSLEKRFRGKKIPKNHERFFTLDYWMWFLLTYRRFKHPSVCKIEYTELFKEKTLKRVFDHIGIPMPEDIYGDNERKLFEDCEIPKEKPSPTDHVNYRHWQINQKIVNMNDPKKINHNIPFFKKLFSYKCFSKLFD